MTTFTGVVHATTGRRFADVVLPQLVAPGFREDDFRRLKDAQKQRARPETSAATTTRSSARSGCRRHLRRHAVRPPGARDGRRARGDHARRREGLRREGVHAGRPDGRRRRRRAAASSPRGSRRALAKLPAGPALPAPAGVAGRKPSGIDVEIIEKETRATAISFGFPIDVTRSHPDFAALSVARAWLGEHRSSSSHLYQRIREVRGMNYGDYAYIEAFPRGMFQILPRPEHRRGAPRSSRSGSGRSYPKNAHMALRIAISELDKLDRTGDLRGGVRDDARLPHEERLPHDGDAGPAARLRPRPKWYGTAATT